MPRRARIRTASGLMYSEHALSRGNRALSTTTTENPSCASRVAVALPAGPAPATSTSYSNGRDDTSGGSQAGEGQYQVASPPAAAAPVARKFTPSLFSHGMPLVLA